MKLLIKLSALIMCLSLLGFSQTVSNVQLTDMEGNSYDLYEVLESGKHILCHFSYVNWPACPRAIPALNDTWDTYGCEICDDYELLVLEVHVHSGESRSFFQEYLDDNNCRFPAIYCPDGGRTLSYDVGNMTDGNPKYLIYPDKTYYHMDHYTWETLLAKENLTPHNCNVSIKTNAKKLNNSVVFDRVTKSGFTLKVLKDGLYSIAFYSADGKLKNSFSNKLSSGSHHISFEKGALANGIYLVEIKNGQKITRDKVMLK